MEIQFFGSGSASNYNRANTSFWVRDSSTTILFDCGERIYHQIRRAGNDPATIDAVFITHNHVDHTAGIPSLMMGLNNGHRENPLNLYGPDNFPLHELFKLFDPNIPLLYSANFQKIKAGDVVKIGNIEVQAFPANHGLPAFMYSIKTSGIKLFYTGDTMPFQGYMDGAQGSDLLVHESTYLHRDEKLREKFKHSSAREAGHAASIAEAKILALVHFSTYMSGSIDDAVEEARKEFSGEIIAVEDFQKIEL